MLLDRKYSLPPEDSDDLTYDSFLQRWNSKFNKDLTILASQRDDDEQKIGVFFPQNPPEAKTRKLSVDQGVYQDACFAAGLRCALACKSAPARAHATRARWPASRPARACCACAPTDAFEPALCSQKRHQRDERAGGPARHSGGGEAVDGPRAADHRHGDGAAQAQQRGLAN